MAPAHEPEISQMNFDLTVDECAEPGHHGQGNHVAGCCAQCTACKLNIRGVLYDQHVVRCRRQSSLPPTSKGSDDTRPPSII